MANQNWPEGIDLSYGVNTNETPNFKNKRAITASPSSSGYNPYEGGISVVPSHRGRTLSHNSSLNPNDMTLDSLTIEDEDFRLPRGVSSHYNNPFHHSVKHSYDSSSYEFFPPGSNRRASSVQSTFPYGGRTGIGARCRSNTWMSPDAQAQQEYLTVRNAMRRLFKNSELAKWKLHDYIAHREAMVNSEANRLLRQVTEKEKAESICFSPILPELQHNLRKWGLKGNFDQEGNLGRVLGEPTIWCSDWENGKDDVAPWPSMSEMKWEGDDRAKTGVGRFLPLPREQGPHNLQWNQLSVIDQYPMDQVAKIPTMEDVYLPVDADIEQEREYLWSKGLEEDIDAFLAS